MMIDCQHGFYMFYPEGIEDQAYFEAQTGFALVQYENGLTFAPLAKLPDFSIKGQPYGNLTAKVNYAGHPADVMRANGFVFDLEELILKDIQSIKAILPLHDQPMGGFISETLPQAGGKYDNKVLLSFTGVGRFNNQQFSVRTYEQKDISI